MPRRLGRIPLKSYRAAPACRSKRCGFSCCSTSSRAKATASGSGLWKAARAAARLLEQVRLGELVAACHRVRNAFDVAEPLSQLQLTSDHGRIVLSASGRIAELDGQLRLELQLPRFDIGRC